MSDNTYHERMKNVPCHNANPIGGCQYVYENGHRDARHACAELAREADAEIAELSAKLAIARQDATMETVKMQTVLTKIDKVFSEWLQYYNQHSDSLTKYNVYTLLANLKNEIWLRSFCAVGDCWEANKVAADNPIHQE